MLPLYLNHLGGEAYGLIGFFGMMQAWFAIFDLGLSPTLSRQTAHLRGKINQTESLNTLVRSIELIFLILSLVAVTITWLTNDWIASKWLSIGKLDLETVSYCILLMGIITALRWFTSLYKGGIQGMEKMLWLNLNNILFSTIRYVGSYILIRWLSQNPTHFFEFQLISSLAELLLLKIKYRNLIHSKSIQKIKFSLSEIKEVLPFSTGIAYTSAIWIILTQTDKLILSHTLDLREYGYYSLVAVVSNGLLSISGPINQAILPRMTNLYSQGLENEMITLYRKATRYISAIILPIAAGIATYSKEIFLYWTKNSEAATWAGPVLTWFILGNAILSISSLPYLLQFAHGKLRLHTINSTINALIQIPALAFSAFYYTALEVAYTWFIMRLISFLIFTTIIHKKFAPVIVKKWIYFDIFPYIFTTFLIYFMHFGFSNFYNQTQYQLTVGFLTTMTLSIGVNILVARKFDHSETAANRF